MTRITNGLVALSVVVIAFFSTSLFTSKPVEASAKERLHANADTLMVPFITNEGQLDSDIRFHTPFLGGEVKVNKAGDIIYDFPHLALTERMVGGSVSSLRGQSRAPTKVNYYMGHDATRWLENIPAYRAVAFGEVYSGVELTLHARGSNVEKIFTVKPGTSPEVIRIAIDGAESLHVNEHGQLAVTTIRGTVRFTKPVAYQKIEGKRQTVQVAYQVTDDSYGFVLGQYNPSQPVIIDPLLHSTFINGPSFNHWGIDFGPGVDNGGGGKRGSKESEGKSIYLAGDRGVPPGFEDEEGPLPPETPLDIYVARFDPSLSILQAYTVLGSPNYADIGAVLSLNDDKSYVYVAGRTYAPDFPVTPGAYDTTFNSATPIITADGYVAKLTTNLDLVAATYIGGEAEETQSHWLDFDSQGNIYFGGKTVSTNFPTTADAYDRTFNGGEWDAYVSKMDPNLSSLLASTYFGGTLCDVTRNGRLDAKGNLFFTGQTKSLDIPVTQDAYDWTHNGGRDFYIAKMDKNFTQLLASTYLGGTNEDFPSYLRIDPFGYVTIVGYTKSPEFPVTPGVYDTTHAGIFDGLVVRMDPNLSTLVRSTFFGGVDVDLAFTFDMDKSGNIYITGRTRSSDYPTTPGAYDTTWNGDFDTMITVFDYQLTTLKASTFIGGINLDMAFAIKWDKEYLVYIAGVAGSPDFPTTEGAYDRTHWAPNTAFALKMDMAEDANGGGGKGGKK